IGIGVEIGYYTFSSGPRYSVIVTQNFAYSQGVMDYDDPPVAAAPEPPADPPADPLPEPQPEPQPLVVLGTSGDDQLSGADLNDTLAGGAGDDTLDGGAGADEMKGGDGSDVFLVDNDQDKVLEASAWTGRDEVISTIDWRLGGQHVEDLTLVGQARFGKGNHLDNRIEGNAEDNTLDGQGGNDTLIGGDGNDVYVIRDAGDVVVEASKAGKDKIFATISVELGANIEQVVLRNVFDANGNGVDGLSVTGNGIGNRIHGNNFDNTLIGRGGNDVLTGRAGADTFVFDRGIKANNIDKITDFASGEDRLQFDADIFDALSIGAISAGQLHFGTAAADADDHFIFNEANGVLMYDADGVGGAAAAHIVTLLHGADLSSDDIFIA
ncbi:MAG: calcium-binding protein, partial [Pseudomonadota bacterium]